MDSYSEPVAPDPVDLLLLDFGGVCLLNPVELHDHTAAVFGIDRALLDWLGPLDPATDPLWRSMIADEITEREYWALRASEVGAAAGHVDLTTREYMGMLYTPARPELIRPHATRVVQAARDAGFAVSVLTNDMRAFHGRDWEADVAFLDLVDHVVDCSDHPFFKPDPRAFELAAAVTGVDPARTLFVDDQPVNVRGALAAGLRARWFDIADAETAWFEIARSLGLDGSDRP